MKMRFALLHFFIYFLYQIIRPLSVSNRFIVYTLVTSDTEDDTEYKYI